MSNPSADGLDMGYVVITHDADSSPDSVMVMGSGHNDLYRTGFEDAWAGDPASPPDWSQITVNGVNPWYQYQSSFQSYNGEACMPRHCMIEMNSGTDTKD